MMLLATIPRYESETDETEDVKSAKGAIDFGNDVQSLKNFINNID